MIRLVAVVAAFFMLAGILASEAPAQAVPARPVVSAQPVLVASPGQPASFTAKTEPRHWFNRCSLPRRQRPFYCRRRAALAWALRRRGCWYSWGGTSCSPGFDCSGLVMMAFSHAGISLPRTTYEMQAFWRLRRTRWPRPGDIILYGYPAYHAAIFVRRGWQVASPHSGEQVQEQRIESGAQFYAIRA